MSMAKVQKQATKRLEKQVNLVDGQKCLEGKGTSDKSFVS